MVLKIRIFSSKALAHGRSGFVVYSILASPLPSPPLYSTKRYKQILDVYYKSGDTIGSRLEIHYQAPQESKATKIS
jgi:hypothetical protein